LNPCRVGWMSTWPPRHTLSAAACVATAGMSRHTRRAGGAGRPVDLLVLPPTTRATWSRYRYRSFLGGSSPAAPPGRQESGPPRAAAAARRPARCWSARTCRRPGRHRHHAPRRRRHGGPGKVQTLDRGAPTPPVQPGSEQQLPVDGERAAVDVTPDHVGVGGLQIDRRPDPAGQDQLPKPRGVGLDGRLNPVSERRTGAAPVRPGPGPQGVANRPGRAWM
jgi:hypothetical protein